MKVIVIGTGYVGLVQGVCLAELGNEVVCIDLDAKKIEKLKKGISPIYEPGIEEMIAKSLKAKRITFDTDLKKYMAGNEVVFIAVGTPPDEDGRADLKYVLAAAEQIGKSMTHYQVIANKSTVPIGTGQMVQKTIAKHYKGKFDVVSNPEFLREGSAIEDWLHPDRVIIGDHSGKGAQKLARLYEVLGSNILITNLETAEMIKYASNSFLATQISFINSLAVICENVGADVNEVARGMKMDKRIGKDAFLNAGLGYGGSCFPKDVEALIQISNDNNNRFGILEEVENVNKAQRKNFVRKVEQEIGDLKSKKIAVWGLAFKPKTDDIRMAPSISIVEDLIKSGAKVCAFDPVAEENVKKIIPKLTFSSDSLSVCKDVDALLLITEWDEFKQINLKKLKNTMKAPYIFDGRNIYDPKVMKAEGFKYYSIGR
jgi:UDPglucose 6-dehydrogenase